MPRGTPTTTAKARAYERELDRRRDSRAKFLRDRRPLGNGFSPVASKQIADVIDVLNG